MNIFKRGGALPTYARTCLHLVRTFEVRQCDDNRTLIPYVLIIRRSDCWVRSCQVVIATSVFVFGVVGSVSEGPEFVCWIGTVSGKLLPAATAADAAAPTSWAPSVVGASDPAE